MSQIYKVMLIVSNCLGYLAVLGGGYFVWAYMVSEENPNRNEFGMGLMLCFLYGLFPSLLSLVLAVWNRNFIRRTLYLLSVALIPSYMVLYIIYSLG